MNQKPLFLAGQWLETEEKLSVIYPYNDEVIAEVSMATPQEMETAIAASCKAFEITRKLEPYERESILDKVVSGLKSKLDEIVETIILESGKPYKYAKAEVERAIVTFTLARNACFELSGELLPLGLEKRAHAKKAIIKKFPLGPIAAISPFNFPINLVAHKLAPAMAAGCPVVLKPASKTPLTALLLAEIVDQAGWPTGALSVLPCTREVGQQLATDERLKLLTFTGSPVVGWKLKEIAGKKRVVLELGGNAGVYVHEDADLDLAAKLCTAAAFGNAGQSCISVQRMYVHKQCYEEFKKVFLDYTNKLIFGDPKDPATDVASMITPTDAKRIVDLIEEASKGGAKILTGGKEIDHHIVLPTVIENPTRTMKVSCLEAFGPIVTLSKVSSFEEGIDKINDSVYGLQAGLFTNNSALAWQAFEKLDVGGVIINDTPTFRVDNMPYGGVKESGFGREGIRYAILDMSEYKVLIF